MGKESVVVDWLQFERIAQADGYTLICGVDEAGRGSLAGSVVAASVILPEGCVIEGVNDSKKLSAKKREFLFDSIKEQCVAYGIGSASEGEVDELNILQASLLAMRRAVEALPLQPQFALIDGNQKANLHVEERTIVQGDAKSASIAAASILAKVTRDRFMCQMDQMYPQYQFAKHKGYGTKLHYEMIAQFGVSPIHRRSFLKKVLNHD